MEKDLNAIVERVERMERLYDEWRAVVASTGDVLDMYSSVRERAGELLEYYDGGLWQKDFETDEAGLLPASLKRGVLSEDGVWNLLTDDKELRRRMAELAERK